MISEIEFALEDKIAKFLGVGAVKWVSFPEFGFGAGVACFDILVDSLGKCRSFSIRIGGTWSLIRSLIVHKFRCADPGGAADILVGVGG